MLWVVLFMLRDGIVCAAIGLVGGCFIAAIVRIIDAIYPSASVWTAICFILLIAIATGFYLAGRVTSPDTQVAARRAAGVLLLASLALTIVLVFLYALPIFRPSFVAEVTGLFGPVISLLFFPILLIAMSVRLSVSGENSGMFVSLVSILGGMSGMAILEFPFLQLMPPSWAIAAGVLMLNVVGIWAIRLGNINTRGQFIAGMLSLVMIVMSSAFAAVI
tara:strand:+ start:389 stop:1045 length:657 start_codon:yes stop_codon:yes gene_type:complete